MSAVPTEVSSALTSAGVAPGHPTEKWASWDNRGLRDALAKSVQVQWAGLRTRSEEQKGMRPCFICRGNYPHKGLERRGSGAELVKLSRSGPQPLPVPFNILCSDNG